MQALISLCLELDWSHFSETTDCGAGRFKGRKILTVFWKEWIKSNSSLEKSLPNLQHPPVVTVSWHLFSSPHLPALTSPTRTPVQNLPKGQRILVIIIVPAYRWLHPQHLGGFLKYVLPSRAWRSESKGFDTTLKCTISSWWPWTFCVWSSRSFFSHFSALCFS